MIQFLFLILLQVQAAQNGIVVNEGAIVYKDASFDAPILGYFSEGTKVRISSKVFGAFYRVRFKPGVIGFISDIDVRPEGQESVVDKLFKSERNRTLEMNRTYLGRFHYGLQIGAISYADTYLTEEASSNTNMLGLALSMPARFIGERFALSTSLMFSISTPDLYASFSDQGPPEGYVLLGDAQLLYLVSTFRQARMTFYVGGGMSYSYTDITLKRLSGASILAVPINRFKVGGVFSLGLSYDLSRFVFRLEPKFYMGTESFFGINTSILF